MKKLYHVNTNQKKAGVAILISRQHTSKQEKLLWIKKKGHYIMTKESNL